MNEQLRAQILAMFSKLSIVVDELSLSGELLTSDQTDDMLEFNELYKKLEQGEDE